MMCLQATSQGPKRKAIKFTEVYIQRGSKGGAKHAPVVSYMAIPAKGPIFMLKENSTSDRYDKGIETQGQRMGASLWAQQYASQ